MDTPLGRLREMFAGRDAESIARALLRAQGDVEAATDMILAEMDEEESVRLLEQQQQEVEQRQRQRRQQQHHDRIPAPLVLKPGAQAANPPILRPQLLSPSSSADSFGALTISDHDDDVVYNDWVDDDDTDGEDVPDMPIEQHRRHQPQLQHQPEENPLPLNHQVDEYLAGVLTIFPDACPEHIHKLYKENVALQGPRITDFIANKLAEDGYPRIEQEPKPGLKRKRSVAEEEIEKNYEAEDRERETNEYSDLV